MTHAAAAPPPRSVPLSALWFGLFAAPAVWSIQMMVSYAIAAHSCYPSTVPRTTPTFGGMWTVELIIGIVALAVAIAAGVTALRSWRASRPADAGPGGSTVETGAGRQTGAGAGASRGRVSFMALAGVLLSSMFLIAIGFNVLGLFLVPQCG